MVGTIEYSAERAVALSPDTTYRSPLLAQGNIRSQLEHNTIEIHGLVVDLVRQGQHVFLVLQFYGGQTQ